MPSLRLLLLFVLAGCAPERAPRVGEVIVSGLDSPGRVRLEDGRVLSLYGMSTPPELWSSLARPSPLLVEGSWKARALQVTAEGAEDCERWVLERDGEWLSSRLVRSGAALACFEISIDPVLDERLSGRLSLATRLAQNSRAGLWSHLEPSALDVPDSIAGVALPLHSKDPEYDYSRELTEIAELGASWISLLVVTRQERVDSAHVPIESAWTSASKRIVETIANARALGLRVLLMPLVLIENMGPDDWRGTLAPTDSCAWWNSYSAYMKHMADLAHRGGAEAFCIGSEFASLEGETVRWERLAELIRLRFGGLLTYSANWDHFDEIAFWERLDFAGMTAYFELSDEKEPSAAELREGWRAALSEVRRLGDRSGLPVFLTEVGIPSARGATAWPWDYTREAPVDLELQRSAFEAFHDVFYPAGRSAFPGFLGQCFYDWWGMGGIDDTGYTARKKPAAEIWRRVLSDTR